MPGSRSCSRTSRSRRPSAASSTRSTWSNKAIDRGRSTTEKGEELLARILPSDKPEDAAGADLVIEAVFEDPKIKEQVWKEIEPHVAPDALLGSNTSTLPITGLAEYVDASR